LLKEVNTPHYPNIKGFSPQNIGRMKQFYETYRDKPKLSPLVREITWSNRRELERQIDSMLFERTMLSNNRNKNLIAKNKSLGVLRDNYTLEFLNLPARVR
jgi:DNA primase catalytic subunit